MKATWTGTEIKELTGRLDYIVQRTDAKLKVVKTVVDEMKVAFDRRSWFYRKFIGRRPMEGYGFEFTTPELLLRSMREEAFHLNLLLARVKLAVEVGASRIHLNQREIEMLELYEKP